MYVWKVEIIICAKGRQSVWEFSSDLFAYLRKGGKMAKPIGATPVLTGKEAEEFLKKVHEDSERKVTLVPTPKLEKACELIKKNGNDR